MGLNYLNFCSYWKNLTSPLTCWHRGTAFHFDVMREHPKMPIALTDLGTDMVMVTMAARILQSIISLGKTLLQKRTLYWKMLPRVCVNKALRAAVWLCWSVIDLLLPLLMTTMYIYKNQSRLKAMCNGEQPINRVTVKCHWGSQMEPEKMIVEDLCNIQMDTVKEMAKMKVDHKCEDIVNKEVLVPSCTNPVILSMICMAAQQVDSSEESEVGSAEGDMSVDSGMQESWTPMSKYEEDSSEESDWSDDDSWDEDSTCHDDEDLWASFCRSDDPYNPLSFSMPTKSPEKPMKEAPIKCLEKSQIQDNMDHSKVVKIDSGIVEKQKTKLCKKPVLIGHKSSHKCSLLKEESPWQDNHGTKKVRFSPKVTVHPIITWSFAHRMARKGPWEEYARDRSRFQRRIAETEAAIGFCLEALHREKIWTRLNGKQN
ncbi:hypothetical protein GDO81_013808 [Engystomops pustulosus]|uniref:Protein phosphatase 1 regulatory subunit 15A n=1 Tax=Engystomops pustulosus TaxID=76066 RepID=A0AAV7B5Q7_ENGPU|nr:hypothetical protein GDO81_013808 [Engystomops pustulosus]KAG8567865.1 hypothetical protein GDO81_013808 [Engystomops pustulosus]